MFISLYLINHLLHTPGAGSVAISPSNDYTTFENNTSTFTFTCSGNGTLLLWTVDGYSTGTPYVLSKGIQLTPFIVSSNGPGIVSSQLIVPTTKANSNITVICTVLDTSYQPDSSNPVRLTLQGTAYNVTHILVMVLMQVHLMYLALSFLPKPELYLILYV